MRDSGLGVTVLMKKCYAALDHYMIWLTSTFFMGMSIRLVVRVYRGKIVEYQYQESREDERLSKITCIV